MSAEPGSRGPVARAAATRVEEIEARSAGFRKELGVVDLTLNQILFVVGTAWVGTAAKLGHAHLFFWLLAIALFYLPQAAVVMYLNRLMPMEGGLYQWATAGLGRFAGYMVGWNLWAFAIVIMATFSVMIATNISYLLGPGFAFVTRAWWYTPALSAATIAGVTLVAVLGLRVGKWIQNLGGAAQFFTYGALVVVPFVALSRGTIDSYEPLQATVPQATPFNLNIFGKMALGALTGFEYVALLAGECRNPARTIRNSVLVAAPVIALMFILGTSSVLAIVPNEQIDLISPIPQTLTMGFQGMGFAGLIVPALILLLVLRQLGAVTLIFAGNTRLPMVAGWDGLLPAWFTRLHFRFRTPVNSIVVVGAITLALTLAGQLGVGVQEAFQLLENAAGILYAFAYLGMFAIPLIAVHRLAERPPVWLRAAALSGFAVTLL
ncbi:MAG TPA: APC family permease, partial [Longimicrobiales bacterium]|nr:APC family permease [Longimicrobiales bacterium]